MCITFQGRVRIMLFPSFNRGISLSKEISFDESNKSKVRFVTAIIANIQITPFKYSTIQIFNHSNIQPFKYSTIQIFTIQIFTIQIFKHSPFKYSPFKYSPFKYSPFKYSTIQIFNHSNIQPFKY